MRIVATLKPPTEMILDLTDAGYVLLGDAAQLNRQAKREKMKAALTTTSETAKVLAQRARVSLRDAQRLLDDLAEHDPEVERTGKGRKGDPYQYRQHSIHATPPVLGGTLRESNSAQTGFDSCSPPSPRANGNQSRETEAQTLYADNEPEPVMVEEGDEYLDPSTL